MTVIPGLSQPLKTIGKRVDEWNEGDDGLRVDVREGVCAKPWEAPFERFSAKLTADEGDASVALLSSGRLFA
jgi:hypothetical protein